MNTVSWFFGFLNDVRSEFTDDVSELTVGTVKMGLTLSFETSLVNSLCKSRRNLKTKKHFKKSLTAWPWRWRFYVTCLQLMQGVWKSHKYQCCNQQDRQWTCSATLRRVRVTTVAVGEKISFKYYEFVCVALLIQHAKRVCHIILSSVACLAVLYFFHIIL